MTDFLPGFDDPSTADPSFSPEVLNALGVFAAPGQSPLDALTAAVGRDARAPSIPPMVTPYTPGPPRGFLERLAASGGLPAVPATSRQRGGGVAAAYDFLAGFANARAESAGQQRVAREKAAEATTEAQNKANLEGWKAASEARANRLKALVMLQGKSKTATNDPLMPLPQPVHDAMVKTGVPEAMIPKMVPLSSISKYAENYGGKPQTSSSMYGNTDEIYNQNAEGIYEGTIPADYPLGRFAAGTSAQLHKAHPDFNLTEAVLDLRATRKWLESANSTPQLRLRQAIDATYHSLDLIDQLSDQLSRYVPRSDIRLLNKGVNLGAKELNALGPEAQDAVRQLQTEVRNVNSEMAFVYQGGNAPTEHNMRTAEQNLSVDFAPHSLKNNTRLMRSNLRIRENSIANAGPISPSNPVGQTPGAVNIGPNQLPFARPAYPPSVWPGMGRGPSGAPMDATAKQRPGRVYVEAPDGQRGWYPAGKALPAGYKVVQ